MNLVLLYISYDTLDYECYIHIAIDEDVKASYIRIPDETDRLYEVLQNSSLHDNDTSWCIVSDVAAQECSIIDDLRSHGYNLLNPIEINEHDLCDLMSRCFIGQYSVRDNDDDDNPGKKRIRILYPNMTVADKKIFSDSQEDSELLKKAEEILSSGGPEKTELARIIEEKYKRMER